MSKDFSTSHPMIPQCHIQRFLNVTSNDSSMSHPKISQCHIQRFLNVHVEKISQHHIKKKKWSQGFFQPPPLGFGLPPLGYAGNSISHVNQFNDTITGELCLCKTAPDSTKLCLSKGPKSKFPRGSMPQTPLVRHMLCTRICACPPIQSHFAPLEQKAERNPGCSHYVMRWHMWNWCVECVYMCVRLCRRRYVRIHVRVCVAVCVYQEHIRMGN